MSPVNSKKTPFTFDSVEPESGLRVALGMSRADIIGEVSACNLRGRGGAGFPTGTKWNLAAAAKVKAGGNKYVVCNADEGEPGTFKDRVILADHADMVFEGMTIAARAIGAKIGILYLRSEYVYLRPHLEQVLEKRRHNHLLGTDIGGVAGFDFDIHIHMGAGAYVCGEETALIESLEGHRGEPRNRPPFPVDTGFNGQPTVVNNVETFAWVVCILSRTAQWFKSIGTAKSTGYKLFSVSGDCREPGVYEFPLGITVGELLEKVGGQGAKAVQVGGASGHCIPASEFGRRIAFEDISTGGSIIVFGPRPRHAGGRAQLHGVLRRGIVRPVHALPGGQREAARGRRDAPAGRVLDDLPAGAARAVRDDAARVEVRAGAVEPERLRLDREALQRRDHGPHPGPLRIFP